MSRPEPCCCGLSYDAFRTRESFASIKAAMRSESTDPKDWRYRTRRMVLGFWHALKMTMFLSHVAECEHYARLEAAERAAARKPRGRSSVHAHV